MSGAIYPDLKNKNVIVTGGGSGIGAAIVEHFARQGARVGLIDIAEKPSRDLVQMLLQGGAEVTFEPADITDIPALHGAIDAIRRRFGGIDILINDAANDDRHATEQVTEAYWDERFAVNLKHVFFASQAVLPDMKEKGAGAIVNFSSISWMSGMGGAAIYTAAKSAMLGLTRSLARDFGAHGIRVNAVAPGWVMTPRQIEKWYTPESETLIFDRQCLKRKLVPDDIAKFVVFLCSDEAGACTNQHYVVDGGWV